ncbi:hypothetical protein AC249_AIPGENE14663 [Exaiptasia diaphana]|nr:hypothetical protein AC249_AIPGENE14663 [Exaiptasia diaphana]
MHTSTHKRKPPKERSCTAVISKSQNVEEENIVEQIEEFSEVSEDVPLIFVNVATQTDCDANEFEATVREVAIRGEKIEVIEELGAVNIWLSQQAVDSTMPEDFIKKYASTRVIIHCSEIKCQMPSSLQLNGELFRSYKNHTTMKGLIGISPGGTTTFVSQLYTGSISDQQIVMKSGFLDLPFDKNYSVMADKGFTIEDLLPFDVSQKFTPLSWKLSTDVF